MYNKMLNLINLLKGEEGVSVYSDTYNTFHITMYSADTLRGNFLIYLNAHFVKYGYEHECSKILNITHEEYLNLSLAIKELVKSSKEMQDEAIDELLAHFDNL